MKMRMRNIPEVVQVAIELPPPPPPLGAHTEFRNSETYRGFGWIPEWKKCSLGERSKTACKILNS